MDRAALHLLIADTIGESELVDTNDLTRRILAARIIDALDKQGWELRQRVTVVPDPPGFELPWA